MRARETGPHPDELAALRFLGGEGTEAERRAFERRLGEEPELAARFAALAETDDALRAALAEAEPHPAQGRRMWLWPWLAAAALLLVQGLFFWMPRSARSGELAFDVGPVATAPADADFNELLGLDPEWLPSGMGYRDAGSAAPSAEEYAAALEAALEPRVEEALEAGEHATVADSWVLAFRPRSDCYLVLVARRADGRTERLLPGSIPNRLFRAGETALLPEDPVRLPDDWRESQRVDYAPGVLTRGGVELILGVGTTPLDAEATRALDRFLETGASAGELSTWLEERAFTPTVLRSQRR